MCIVPLIPRFNAVSVSNTVRASRTGTCYVQYGYTSGAPILNIGEKTSGMHTLSAGKSRYYTIVNRCNRNVSQYG